MDVTTEFRIERATERDVPLILRLIKDLAEYERMSNDGESGKLRGGVHGGKASILARMKEYQAVTVRLSRHTQDDEDALTDLLNERSRGGWELATMTQDGQRLTIVFQRLTESDR